MHNPVIRIGTRGSDLALWQANHVKQQLEALGYSVEINIIHTQGDKIQDLSFDKLEGKGFFTKEIEEALLNGKVDLAVHSHKDLETTPPHGLVIAAVSDREDPRDMLLIRPEALDEGQPLALKKGAIVGTSSARRQSLLRFFRDDVCIEELRGNVPTRIEKLRNGTYDAILLAKAGVARLGLDLSDLISIALNPKEFIPAPAQGVLGLQVRESDRNTYDAVRKLNNESIEKIIRVERDVLRHMEGGCQLPLGVYNDGTSIHVAYARSKSLAAKHFHFPLSEENGLVSTIVQTLTKT
ncbi:MAG: hypothetical protein RIQ90_293 [Bacteroidota bacterium]|jgi:hydroxymethylbilane synthase